MIEVQGSDDLIIRSRDSGGDIKLESRTSQVALKIVDDAAVELYHGANGKKFETTSTGVTVTGIITATTFSGSGANLTSIPNSALTNDSVSFGGVSVDLGASDATPAFDLSDATDYPYTSLTGITTEIVGDTTPQLGGNLDLNGKDITGTGNFNITGIVTFSNVTAPSGANSIIYAHTEGGATSGTLVLSGKQDLRFNTGGFSRWILDGGDLVTHATTYGNLGAASDSGGRVGNGYFQTSVDLIDDGELRLGTGDDLKLYHDGSNSIIDSSTGDLLIRNLGTTGDIYLDAKSGERGIKVIQDGAVELYHDNSQKFTTTSSGVTVTGVITATSFSGSGANLTNLPASDGGGDKYNTGITTSIYVSITGGIGTAQAGLSTVAANNDIFIGPGIGYSFPSTAGKSYVIESIHVTNIYNTNLYLTSRHDFNGGQNTPTAQRVVIPYQGALEVLEEPIIAKPSDILRFQAFVGVGTTATGVNNGLDSFITYTEKDDADFIGIGTTVTTASGTELFTSTTNSSVIQSIRLCNYDLDIDVDASVSIYRGGTVGGITTTGARQGYLAYNLTVPKNSVIEILERPKYLAANDTVVVGVAGSTLTNSLSSTLSGKYIT